MKFRKFKNKYSNNLKSIIGNTSTELLIEDLLTKYDWETYFLLNPDLMDNGVTTIKDAINHWITHGEKEGRLNIEPNFKWENYLTSNIDLIDDNINTKEKAIKHWLTYGKNEERQINLEFNWEQYIAINPDVYDTGITTKDAAIEHWLQYGYKEKRLVNLPSFNWQFYIYYNIHLLNAGINTEFKAANHWFKYGKHEKILFSLDQLNYEYYKMIKFKMNINYFDRMVKLNTKHPLFKLNNTDVITINRDQPIKTNTPLFKKFNMIHNLSNYSNLILIIDFPYYGGGCSTFLNYILTFFKKSVTFLIARNFNGQMFWYINDDLLISRQHEIDSNIRFLDRIKDKIQKVFINSIIGHSAVFLQKVFEINKHITAITHDYSLLFNKPQMYFHEAIQVEPNTHINIQKIDTIITQNENNLAIYGKHLNETQEIVITNLPDYVKSLQTIQTNNTKTMIGIIGNISNIKGYYVISKLIELVNKNSNELDLVIFGKMNINYSKKFPYGNIKELNELLQMHKPNLWFEASIWPETYSYTLSLAMITQLPILYQNKYFPSTIKNRLTNYSLSHSFDDIENINIQFIQSLKQDWFNTIEPNIYFPTFWKHYFSLASIPVSINDTLCSNVNLVIITSKIHTTNIKFNYSKVRSIYTPHERFIQTMDTIKSIRKYIPNSFIILFDNSTFLQNRYNIIHSLVNVFINTLNDDTLNYFTNNSDIKMYGEVSQTFNIIKYIQNTQKCMKISNLFKISGRYIINETFNYDQYENSDNIFKQNPKVTDRKYYYTSFYKIGASYLPKYYNIIENIYDDILQKKYEGLDWEVLLPRKLNYEFETVNNLGITQNIGVWNDKSQI